MIGQLKELLKYKAAAQTNIRMPRNPTASRSTLLNLEVFFLSFNSLFGRGFKGFFVSVVDGIPVDCPGFDAVSVLSFSFASAWVDLGFVSFCCFSSSSNFNFSHD